MLGMEFKCIVSQIQSKGLVRSQEVDNCITMPKFREILEVDECQSAVSGYSVGL